MHISNSMCANIPRNDSAIQSAQGSIVLTQTQTSVLTLLQLSWYNLRARSLNCICSAQTLLFWLKLKVWSQNWPVSAQTPEVSAQLIQFRTPAWNCISSAKNFDSKSGTRITGKAGNTRKPGLESEKSKPIVLTLKKGGQRADTTCPQPSSIRPQSISNRARSHPHFIPNMSLICLHFRTPI